ncbi:type VI secretion system protein ImpJ/VasE [Chitinispirillum alkaliphilum]|nr:type VI secretion system protein ImpJ/VasE [Chitinispirillum alkaliphilum]
MFVSEKVIWKEGIFLQPQHFQQSERYLSSCMQARFSAYNQFYSGFLNFDINTDSLANDSFTLNFAQGVLPDGTFFSIPDSSSPPQARNFGEHFTHDQKSLDVYLGLPLVLSGRGSVTDEKTLVSNARYKTETHNVVDEVYGESSKDIELGRSNFTILFGNESRDNYSTLPLARLTRMSNGQIGLDKTFIPPVLRIGASHTLCNQIKSLLEMLLAKSSSLSQGRKQLKGGFAEFAPHDTTPLALLTVINSYTPLLNNHLKNSNIHPHDLFLLMLSFSGALCTFSSSQSIDLLPQYRHTAPAESFERLTHIIREILGADISAGCINLALNEISPATYTINVPDEKLFDLAAFYLGISADVPEKELIVGSLSRVKISSRNQLDTLIQSAMPGLPVMFNANPPKDLSTKPGYIYFSLNQQNSFWDAIKATGSMALYFPNDYPNLKIELLAITS